MNIKNVIKNHGMKIVDIADAIGMHRVSLSNTVLREGSNPTVKTLRSIAKAIGCDITDFFADEVSEKSGTAKSVTALVKMGDRCWQTSDTKGLRAIADEIDAISAADRRRDAWSVESES